MKRTTTALCLIGLAAAVPAQAITIDGVFSDWTSAQLIGTDPAGDVSSGDTLDWLNLRATYDSGTLYLSYQTRGSIDFAANAWRYAVFIDADSRTDTGYRGANNEFALGADYLLEGAKLHRYVGDGTSWTWTVVGNADYRITGDRVEMGIVGALLGMTGEARIKLMLAGINQTTTDYARNDKGGFAYPKDRIVLDARFSDWNNVAVLGSDPVGDVGAEDPVDWRRLRALGTNGMLYLGYETAKPIDLANHAWRYAVLIDSDNDTRTGYTALPGGSGAEYLIEGTTLFRYAGPVPA
jgi:hypothetical protein